jgi:hypothetical protein
MQEKFKKVVPYIFPFLILLCGLYVCPLFISRGRKGNGLLISDLDITNLTQKMRKVSSVDTDFAT